MTNTIIGLVGPLASGKGTVKSYIEEQYGGKDCRFSTPLRDILARLALPASRENLQALSTVLRQTFGEDLLARTIAADVAKLDAPVVVIDGVRRFADIEHLSALPNFFLVSIDADPHIRYGRMKKRNENAGDDRKTFEEFMRDHESEADRHIPEVMARAKCSIRNDGTLEELYRQVDGLIERCSAS